MNTRKKTIACFGATGGSVGTALALALKEGSYCTALARNPEKLRIYLSTEHQAPLSIIEQQLTIHQGDVKDPIAVSKVLISPVDPEALVDVILSGVGAYPTFQWSITRPFPLTDPTICETAIGTIFKALSDLYSATKAQPNTMKPLEKPLLVVVSTAGCGRHRGVPLPIDSLYRYILGGPLADKIHMEEVIFKDKGEHIRDFVIVRPLFLTNGEARGENGLRVGWEWGIEKDDNAVKEPGPTIGYYVSRKDVGAYTFEKVIVQGGWEGKCVYLTY